MKGHKSPEDFIENNPQYAESLNFLRELILSVGLVETIKWGIPVYTHEGKNVVGMATFKSYFAIWFYQGELLSDEAKKLHNAQEGKTKALRQWRFQSLNELQENDKIIRAYIQEAILNQEKGLEIKPERNKPLILPQELEQEINSNQALKQAFENLTLGKRRDYAEHISAAKRSETKQKRLDKIRPMILEGIGLNDKYKSRKS